MPSGNDIRSTFLNYFGDRGHEIVASSPLVPGNDPTLLFTNAGMVQFKDMFLGAERRDYTRATTSQRCVRAGGKHNDLENVGYTARHHTFFEMLGNFSFGDYFKHEAIEHCWGLLTQDLGLPADKLWVTVFEDDDEAADIWIKDMGVDSKRFSRCGAKDNFWSMGDTGPCGPCSEVFYDHGPDIWGGPPGTPEEDGDRYIELWNLVFMQFNRTADGVMTPLPNPSIDTGMGLERIAAVLQGVHSNFETDLFVPLIEAAGKVTNARTLEDKSLRVIADHIRSCSFLVVDGVEPSNEGRGYVLRRIIRRAIRHGYQLGAEEPFFHRLVRPLTVLMGAAYPELANRVDHVERVLKTEEERFAETLDQGMRILDEAIAGLSSVTIPGETVFKLYDTYGFPMDLTADVARERGLNVDQAGFDVLMEQQRERARAASQFTSSETAQISVDAKTQFTGYEKLDATTTVHALFLNGESVGTLSTEETGIVVVDTTPFYAESGGQVGDRGVFEAGGVCFEVNDTQKRGESFLHSGVVTEGELQIGMTLTGCVDADVRAHTVRNHSGTHLLHAALRCVLGEHVVQKGSLVTAERLRFDFSHESPISPSERVAIERLVNDWVLKNDSATAVEMRLDDALESGVLALFGEKYDDVVRVMSIGDVSRELCGGTHVSRSGDVGLFKIVSETGVAAGIRRIEALTGNGALEWIENTDRQLLDAASQLKSDRDGVGLKLSALLARTRDLEKELDRLKSKLASTQGSELVDQAVEVSGLKVLAVTLEGADSKSLRVTMDRLKDKLGSAVIVLAAVNDGKVSLVAGVTKDSVDRIKAGTLVNFVAEQVGGKGGGRPDMAQAGGSDPAQVEPALASVHSWVTQQLA
jgi:alanyl-tRNA synthetase